MHPVHIGGEIILRRRGYEYGEKINIGTKQYIIENNRRYNIII